MSIPQFTKVRLNWLFNNAKRLNWLDEAHPYRDFALALQRCLKNDVVGADRDMISKWTSGRYSEVYAHQLDQFYRRSELPFSTWETVGEIHTALSTNVHGSDPQ